MKLTRDSCIRIPRSLKEEQWVTTIISNLIREAKTFADKGEKVTQIYYDVDDTDYMIPRFYPVARLGHEVIDIMPDGEDIDVVCHVKPWNELQENAINWMVSNTQGCLKLPPAQGKTVIGIATICKIGKKPIIFVHTDHLKKQWIEEFVKHTELQEENIALLKSSTFQKDLNKPVVISTVQTFCSLLNKKHKKNKEFMEALKRANFGIAIWDECHTSVSAEMFSKSSLHLAVKRVFGMSATPIRTDRNTDIINMHLGEVHVPEGEMETVDPEIVMINFDFKIMDKYYFNIHQLYLKDDNRNRGIFNKATYLSKLIKSEILISTLQQVVKQLHSGSRQALVLSERINLLEASAKVLPQNSYGLFVGGSDRKEMLSRQIVLSTYQMSRDGLNVPRLDSAVFCTPVTNIEQAAGRIQRRYKGKPTPIIIDIVDTGCKDMKDRARYRRKFYTQQGWKISERILD